MIKRFLGTVAAAALLSIPADKLAAQGFVEGYMDIGPTIGIGGIGDAGLSFGARFEKGLKPMTGLGSGNLGIQVGFDYFSWSTESFGFGNYSWTNISIGATANYHFKLVDTKFDPFVGLGLGYENWSCDYGGSGNLCGAYSSAIYFIGRAGGRYFVSEKVALYADVGAGAATLNLGAMFRLK